jgi:hypothetical protein
MYANAFGALRVFFLLLRLRKIFTHESHSMKMFSSFAQSKTFQQTKKENSDTGLQQQTQNLTIITSK